MHKYLLALAAALALAVPASAQDIAPQCKDAVDASPVGAALIDSVPCARFGSRWYTDTGNEGIEENSIIGVGTAEVTLDHAELSALNTARQVVVPVPAPTAGKYLFIDWIAVAKEATTTASSGFTGSAPAIGIVVAPATGGAYTGFDAVQLLVHTGPNGLVRDDAYVARYFPSSFGGRGFPSIEATPVVITVRNNASVGDWPTLWATVDSSIEIRFIVHYRVIDTDQTFEEASTP